MPNDEIPICEKCGKPHVTRYGKPACGGHINSDTERKGDPCTHELGFGTSHKGHGNCKFHGGSSPNGKKSGDAKALDAEVHQLLGLNEWEPITDPYFALASHAGKSAALESIMHQKVEELVSLKQYGGEFGDRLDVVIEAWERARARLGSKLIAMTRLDLDAKIAKLKARVDNETAEIVQSALAGALGMADLTPEIQEMILREFGSRLRQPSQAEMTVKALVETT